MWHGTLPVPRTILTTCISPLSLSDREMLLQTYSVGYFEMMKRKLCQVNPDKNYWLRQYVKAE